MKKTWGIFLVFVAVCAATAMLSPAFLNVANLENLVLRVGLYGILALGVSFVIITGGIDLSIGSVVGLAGCGLPWLLVGKGWPPEQVIGALVAMSAAIGLLHGLLVTKLRLQPFVVTLCGLLVYRGVLRGVTGDQSQGFGSAFKELRFLATGQLPFGPVMMTAGGLLLGFGLIRWLRSRRLNPVVAAAGGGGLLLLIGGGVFRETEFGFPMPFVIMLVVAGVAAVFLNLTVWGRHLLALGNNEEAARFSGIATDRLVILSYVVCSMLAALAGGLFVMEVNSAQPSDFGNFYELYAIAAAVIGGCSLRGGQGAVFGVVIGAALMQVLRNMIVLVFPRHQNLEFAVIGLVILIGVAGDEVFKRLWAKRRIGG